MTPHTAKASGWLKGTLLPAKEPQTTNNKLKIVTMSYDLIKSLQPHQRAILHQALLNYKQEAETMLADSHDRNANHAHRLPLDWLAKETKQLMNTLFAESRLDDLEPLDHFLAAQKEQQNASGNIAGIP